MLDRSILPRRIHRLEDKEKRPAILAVKHLLQLRERVHSGLERLLRGVLVVGLEAAGVSRIDVFQPELLSISDSVGLGPFVSFLDNFFDFHMVSIRSSRRS